VTRKVRPSAFLSSKMATALVVSPILSGHLAISTLRTLELCCLISLARGATIQKKRMRYIAAVALDPVLLEMVQVNYLHVNHLMVRKSAVHIQMNLLITSLSKVARTCSQTRRMETSQSVS
jgi:hypothetical protein